MRRTSVVVVLAAVLLAGCSSEPPAQEPVPAPTAATPTPAPQPSTASCPDGSYTLTRLEGRGSAAGVGTASGGDVAAEFGGGDFTLRSDGAVPMAVDLGGTKAQLRLTGSITGTYEGEPSALRMSTTGAQGEVAIKAYGLTRTRSASTLADQLVGQDATAQAVCDQAAGTALLTLPQATLTLARKG